MRDCRRIASGHPRASRCLLLIGCAAVALLSNHVRAAGTLPSGGHFVAGSGGIAAAGGTTTITQSSKRGIIDWQSFSIGKGNTVQFDNGTGATLNKVTGGSLSTISGQLKATGSVYLINPNGVVVGPGGKVVTGGDFVASTRGVTDGQFMAGGTQTFSGASNGTVVNDGAVVSQTGSVVLIGHAVTNRGSVDAAKGTAALASGDTVLMTDAKGPGGIYVAKSKSGDTTNAGQVRAASVALASAGGNVYALAGNRTGLISATGTKTVDGQVWLTAPEGAVDVAGTVAAKNADGAGGEIVAKGASLKLQNAAVLNAAGKTGRGKIETSGETVSIGRARVTAGKKGTWTVDPTDLTIDAAAASTIEIALNAGTDVAEQTTLVGAIGVGTQSPGNGDIIVAAPISWSSTAQLSLISYNDIRVNAAITTTTGALAMLAGLGQASGSVTISSPLTAHTFVAQGGTAGSIVLADGTASGVVNTTGGGQAYLSSVVLGALTVLKDTNGIITFNSTVDAKTAGGEALSVDAGTGHVFFGSSVGANKQLDGFSATGTVELAGSVSSNNSIVVNGTLQLDTAVTLASNDRVTLNATVDGNVGLTVHSLTTATFGQTVGGTTPLASLTVSANAIALNGSAITTVGAQTFGGATTLGADTTLTSTANGAIGLTATNGAFDLAVNTGGTTTFGGAVGGSTALASVTTDAAGTTALNAGTVKTTGSQTYNDAVTLGANGALISTGSGAIDLANTVNGAFALSVSTGGTASFGGAAGGTTPLASLSVTGGTLTLAGAITTSGQQMLISTGAGNTLAIDGTLTATGSTITLTSAGPISQTAIIKAGTLTGSSVGGTTLNGNNQVDVLGALTDTGGSSTGIQFTDARAFSTSGTLLAGSGGVHLNATGDLTLGGDIAASGQQVVLVATGAISQSAGAITGAGVSGSAVSGISLTDANHVTAIGNLQNTGSGLFTVTNAGALSVSGPIGSVGDLTLTAAGLTLGGDVTGNTVTFASSWAITQLGGIVTASTLTGSSVGGATLNRSNLVTTLGTFTDTGAGNATGFSLTDAQALSVGTGGGETVSSTGPIALVTTGGSGSPLLLKGNLAASGQTVSLTAAGAISQTSGAITAGTLTGSAVGGALFQDTNLISNLGNFNSAGDFALLNAVPLTQTAGTTVDAGSGVLAINNSSADFTQSGTLKTASTSSAALQILTSGALSIGTIQAANGTVVLGPLGGTPAGGPVTETGTIIAAALNSRMAGPVTLDGSNAVGTLSISVVSGSPFTTDFSFTDTAALTVSSASNVRTLTLTTTGGAGMTLSGAISATSIVLNSAGTIAQTGGIVTASSLSGSSAGGAALNADNVVDAVGSFVNTASGDISLKSVHSVAVGVLTTPGNVTLDAASLDLTGNITVGGSQTVTLTVSGSIAQTGGVIDAHTLTGSSVTGATLNGSNLIDILGPWTDTGPASAGVSVRNAQALATSGTISATGPITLTTTGGTASALVLGGSLTASGRIVTLNASGAISQTGGVITAGTLTGLAFGDVTLDKDNRVGTFSVANAPSVNGSISFTDTVALTLPDEFSVNNLTITTKNGAGITVTGHIHADVAVTLNSAGRIVESGAGFIETGTEFSGSSVGGATLNGSNLVATFDNFTNTGSGGISFTNTAIDANAGGIAASGNLSLTVAGISVIGDLTAGGRITLTSTGDIAELGSSVITAGALTGTATGGVDLTGANRVAVLGAFSSGAGHDFAFTDARSFSTSGTISSSGALTLTTGAGDRLIIGGALTAPGVVKLDIGGKITQSAGSVITASTLTGSSVGGARLTGANRVGDLGAFSDTGASAGFSFTDAQALTTTGTVSSTGSVILTTTVGDLVLNADVTAPGGAVRLSSAGGITQGGGAIDPGSLLINAAGNVSLTGANTVDTIAARITGAGATLTFNDTANDLMVGTVGGVSGITTNNGDIVLRTTTSGDIALRRAVDAGTGTASIAASGNLAIGAGGSVAAGAGATLATLGNFSNAAGAGAITVGSGHRWLVYSTDPATDRARGLTPDFIQYGATYDIGTLTGTAAAAGGNGFLYSVTPTLTLTGVTKTYDGTTGLTGASFTFSGAATGDTVTLGGSPAGSFADKNAGSGIDVTLSGLTVTATHGGIAVYGYTVAPVTGGPIGTIDRKTLTVALTGTVGKTYDGTTGATLAAGNYLLTGAIGGDAVALNDPGAGTYGTKDAGTGIAVTVTGLALSGADAGNYVLTTSSASAAIGVIDPKTLTAGLTGSVVKTYDGTRVATLTGGNYVLAGLIAGDSVMLNDPASGTYASAGSGTGIGVTVRGLALTGADAGNYRLATTTVSAAVGVITPVVVTPPPPPPPPPPPVMRPPMPFIPVPPPQPPDQGATEPQAVAANVSAMAHALVVAKPELAELARLSGCSGEDFVAVVPGDDGHVGTVVVESEGNKTVLHAAYAGCSGSKPVISTPKEVNALFGGALAARPAPPVDFVLYYHSGSVTLEPNSRAVFDKAFAEIARRKLVDVVVTGFTDTIGTPHGNDLLSLARAEEVTKLLLAHGLMPGAIATYGRGARGLQVPTGPQVAEEKNRRVEITVR